MTLATRRLESEASKGPTIAEFDAAPHSLCRRRLTSRQEMRGPRSVGSSHMGGKCVDADEETNYVSTWEGSFTVAAKKNRYAVARYGARYLYSVNGWYRAVTGGWGGASERDSDDHAAVAPVHWLHSPRGGSAVQFASLYIWAQ